MRSPRDVGAGLIYVAFGAAAVILARGYGLGTTVRMGPGYFPTVLGGLLLLIGLLSVARGLLRAGPALAPPALSGLLAIAAATVAFGALARGAGLAVAMPLLVIVSARASRSFRWTPTLVLAAGLTVFCALVFVRGLGVPLPVIGPWLGGG